jgi:HEAT repeat protein
MNNTSHKHDEDAVDIVARLHQKRAGKSNATRRILRWIILSIVLFGLINVGAFFAIVTMMGPPKDKALAVNYWAAQCKDKDARRRCAAARALWEFGPEAKAAVPALTELLNDENWPVRWTAAEALGLVGPEAKTAVPALMEVLRDEDAQVRWAAALALGQIGHEADAAIPALRELLKDKDSTVRGRAREALDKIK